MTLGRLGVSLSALEVDLGALLADLGALGMNFCIIRVEVEVEA